METSRLPQRSLNAGFTLEAFRLLVQKGPDGLSAGVIADKLGVLPSSLTFHLQQLQHAGLITQRRLGRQLFYAADFAAMNNVVAYLTEHCCGGDTSCEPVCQPAKSSVNFPPSRRTA